jgi:hypothetical protein
MVSQVSTTLNVTCATPQGEVKNTIEALLPFDTPFDKLAPVIQRLINANIPVGKFLRPKLPLYPLYGSIF